MLIFCQNLKISSIREGKLTIVPLSYIEIWENTGDLINPSYQGELLDNFDGYQFFNYDYGEIIRINHDQCEVSLVNDLVTDHDLVTVHDLVTDQMLSDQYDLWWTDSDLQNASVVTACDTLYLMLTLSFLF